MKTIRVVSIICWVVIVAIVFGLVGWFLNGSIFGLRPAWLDRNVPLRIGISGTERLTGTFSEVNRASVSIQDIDSISISWVAGDITITPHDGIMIDITEFAQRDLHDNEKFSLVQSGGNLAINFRDGRNNIHIDRMPRKQLEVRVPHNLANNMSLLSVSAVSSEIEVDGFVLSTFEANTTSGNVIVSNVDSRNLDIDTISGVVTISESSADALDISSTSGRIEAAGTFNDVRVNTISASVTLQNDEVLSDADIRTTSGFIRLDGAFSSVNTNSVSGTTDIRSIIVPSVISASSTSGNVGVIIPGEDSITVRHSSTSGSFTSEIPVIMESRGAQFTFSTTSANVSINELR